MARDGDLRRARRWATGGVLLLSAAIGGCGRRPVDGRSAPAADPSSYVAPPSITRATGLADGGVTLSGQAPQGALVRLRSPDGSTFSDTANADGGWTLSLPPADAPRMFAIEAEADGRDLHGEGAVLTLPSQDAPALLLRSGYGAAPIGRGGALALAAIDYDGGGGGAISGFAQPGAAVRFLLDGQPVGGGQGDATGRFALLDLNTRKPFTAGQHLVRVESRGRALEAQVVVGVPDPGGSVFHAAREGDAWRLDWRLPAGGAQTTLAFDPPRRAGP